jgi:preprotein translocase subunit SecY
LAEEKGGIRRVIEALTYAIPEIKKPTRKLGLGEKLLWTGLVLLIYESMASVTLYGLPEEFTGGTSPRERRRSSGQQAQ